MSTLAFDPGIRYTDRFELVINVLGEGRYRRDPLLLAGSNILAINLTRFMPCPSRHRSFSCSREMAVFRMAKLLAALCPTPALRQHAFLSAYGTAC